MNNALDDDGLPDLDNLDLDAILEAANAVPSFEEFCGYLAVEVARENEHKARIAAAEAAKLERARRACGRCGGKGVIHYFSHHLGGTCFGCDGTGIGKVRAVRGSRGRFAA